MVCQCKHSASAFLRMPSCEPVPFLFATQVQAGCVAEAGSGAYKLQKVDLSEATKQVPQNVCIWCNGTGIERTSSAA